MITALTAGGFGVVTLLAIRRHLKRLGRSSNETRSDTTTCPRCSARLRGGPDECPKCHVPLQLFELVSAPVVQHTEQADDDAPPRALVRSDLCVGCGACVDACPEPGALSMRGKLAVVDPGKCKGHGECIPACPLGAISVARGNATNRVVVPQVDVNFQTSVPGLYIVGELGGRALIKNAVNEGRVAAEHVVQLAVRRRGRHRAAATEPIADIAIIGSGPAGLSAGLVAHRAGIAYMVLEQGTLAETVRSYPRHKVLFAEPLTMPLYGDLWVSDASKESLLAVWEGVIARTGLRVDTGQRVRTITREDGCFVVNTDNASHRAHAVVLALGRRGTPRRLNVPGEDLPIVFYDIAEMSDFAGRRVLVVGAGDSAVESALGLANQTGTTVTLSYRGDAVSRVKERNRTRIEAAIADGRVTALRRSVVKEIRPDMAIVDVDGTTEIVWCDDVVVRIGGEPPNALLDQLGVRMVTKELAPPSPTAQLGSGDAA